MYQAKKREEKEAEVKALIESAEKKVDEYFKSPHDIKQYLDFMSKFYNYSLNNTMLISHQFNGAIAVGSYAFWKEKGFSVNKGEKGIKILVPIKGKDRFENELGEIKPVSKATNEEKLKISNGIFEVHPGKIFFSQGYVFDISQTNAKTTDLPKIFPNKWLEGSIPNYDILYKGMESIAKKIGIEIVEPFEELGVAKGASYPSIKKVALNPRNSQLQNIKTLLHELTHAKLHSLEKRDNYEAHEKEFQAELTAYTICSHFGMDTSEYSLDYLSYWTKDKSFNDKKQLLNEVKETVIEYIDILESELIKCKEKNINKDDSFMKEYLEKQKRRSLAQTKNKNLSLDL